MTKQLVITADVETEDDEELVAAVEAAMPAILVGLVESERADEIANLLVEVIEEES